MSVQTANLFRSISNAAWSFGRNINSILPHGKLPQPSWAPGPLPRSWERFQWRRVFQGEHYHSVPSAIVKQWRA